ncbi:hypothetical protein [Facklamia sp. P12934]|uniref:hypothetical protein n=1 Tax=unclassified Facklamia TaxID=2622293 RepID=UPI003D16F1BD
MPNIQIINLENAFDFIDSLTFSDWISFIALLVSLYSVFYIRKENSYRIQITDLFIDEDDKYNPPMLQFSLFNDSKNSVTIKNLEIKNVDGSSINFLPDYIPSDDYYSNFPRVISPGEYQQPFETEIIIPANKDQYFSYYLSSPIKEAKITITTKQNLRHFNKSQSFIVKFSKLK